LQVDERFTPDGGCLDKTSAIATRGRAGDALNFHASENMCRSSLSEQRRGWATLRAAAAHSLGASRHEAPVTLKR
jgi:hypothetical protein